MASCVSAAQTSKASQTAGFLNLSVLSLMKMMVLCLSWFPPFLILSLSTDAQPAAQRQLALMFAQTVSPMLPPPTHLGVASPTAGAPPLS